MKKNTLSKGKYAHHSYESLLRAFIEGPDRLQKSIEGLSLSDLRSKPIEGKWSIVEIVIHLADGEIIGACRFRQAYTNHQGPFPFYAEATWAEMMNYQQQPRAFLVLNLKLFRLLRETTFNLLRNLKPEDWARTGVHPERGTMTVRGLLELYADHSERHIAQILERRVLIGKPLKMELILKDRLY